MAARIDHTVTSGIFSLDGEDFDVDNNVWLVGDDSECIVIDAPHSADAIAKAVGARTVRLIVCTHAHNDHINAAGELSKAFDAPIAVHPADRMLWDVVYPDRAPDRSLAEGQRIAIAGTELTVMETPGHSPGGICLYSPELASVFTGDTLFHGGPGATGRSYSDKPTILDSIQRRLLTLPERTAVHTGHGEDTTIGAEARRLSV